jgi:L-fuconate dehydratase
MTTITGLDVLDIRFPTSRNLDGSDAMNLDPDYSAAYVIVRTSEPSAPEGHGLTFTIGRGTEVVVAGVEALRPLVVGRSTEELFADMGGFWRTLVGDSQLRWIGPEKGVIHLATAAVVNAVWDLFAKTAGKPLWKLICDMSPEEQVALVDFRYISDALTPERALERLRGLAGSRSEREAELVREGYPAYATSVGWLGYDDDKIRRLCREALAEGWTAFKLKVGADVDDDRRRAAIVREEIGPDRIMAVDANQRWGVDEAIAWMDRLREFGTLKAIGAANRNLYQIITWQAVLYAVAGYVLGIGASFLVADLSAAAGTRVLITPLLVAGMFVLTVVMCTTASFLSIIRVTNLEPAMVFK